MNQEEKIRHFFSPDRWLQSIDRFPLSGFSLVDHVNALDPQKVIDIGCGFNPFKGKIQNLIGIDIANDAADVVDDFMNVAVDNGSIDVLLALGSINFGNMDNINDALTVTHRWLKPGGRLYMRANPGEPIGEDIVVFPWSEPLIKQFADTFQFMLLVPLQEERLTLSNGIIARRLFWIYQKPES